ncbi:hypothetical protein CN454_04990 [Bacillus cereus]|uniref:hypothetical protein n=1 Tax=Bacillus cereus TaxID=1396 RepID=UPI000BF85A12|nr:hypothetical protein [Bacillus cereus]PEQ78185.1 hypothetical protein CN482_27365 [Bacillus cereus]PES08218.1 hypothetical protein CN501_27860 [Bacillus cereus]PEX15988.1 hypothetical protein CN454_04990 [Bacillus cereus]PGY80095.1 hypothetical protein COE36_29610 [Bacillus cereus]
MKTINKYLPYFVLVSVVILDLIIFYAVMDALKVLEKELIVGLIAFLGSILGGLITLVGVNATLKHRDREVFLISATEKLLAVDKLITDLKEFPNNITIIDASSLDSENKCLRILKEADLFYKQLDDNKELIYKNIDYDKVHMIDYYQKTLYPITRKLPINEEEKDACIEKVQSIFGILLESKEEIQSKYYKYKKHNN